MGLAQLKKPPQGQIYVRHQSHDRRRVTNARRHIGKNHFATIGLRQGDQFLQTDPIGSKDDLDLYAYTGDDPINHTDPTGLIINIPDADQRKTIVSLINSQSKEQYKVDSKGNLVRDTSAKNNKSGSGYYSKQIDRGIAGKQTTSVAIADKVQMQGKTATGKPVYGFVNLSDTGGGLTTNGGKNVYINNQSSYDTGLRGESVKSSPAQILAHELGGHAVPELYGGGTGNAIKDENIIRSQTGAPLLAPQPDHTE